MVFILELFLILVFIAGVLFGKIEIHKKTGMFFFRFSMVIAGKQYPLITIAKNSLENQDKL